MTLTLLLSTLAMCKGNLNSVAYHVLLHPDSAWRNINNGAHPHLCSGESSSSSPTIWQVKIVVKISFSYIQCSGHLNPPNRGFFPLPWAGEPVLWSLNDVPLYSRATLGPLLPCFHLSCCIFMRSFYPLLCRSCSFRHQFFLRMNCSLCRCRFSVYVGWVWFRLFLSCCLGPTFSFNKFLQAISSENIFFPFPYKCDNPKSYCW